MGSPASPLVCVLGQGSTLCMESFLFSFCVKYCGFADGAEHRVLGRLYRAALRVAQPAAYPAVSWDDVALAEREQQRQMRFFL